MLTIIYGIKKEAGSPEKGILYFELIICECLWF